MSPCPLVENIGSMRGNDGFTYRNTDPAKSVRTRYSREEQFHVNWTFRADHHGNHPSKGRSIVQLIEIIRDLPRIRF